AEGDTLKITGEDGAVLASHSLKAVRATSRLGSMRRRLDLPDGASFDTEDNDAVDALQGRSGILHRLERAWRTVLASVLVAALGDGGGAGVGGGVGGGGFCR